MAHLLLRPVRDQGLLGQVEGRTADDAAYWLARASPAWRDRIEVVAIGMCSIYASTIRRILPQAQIVVDLFHAVQLAVKVTGDVRRRAVREKYGRRGRSGDAEYGVKGPLVRNLEHLSPPSHLHRPVPACQERHQSAFVTITDHVQTSSLIVEVRTAHP